MPTVPVRDAIGADRSAEAGARRPGPPGPLLSVLAIALLLVPTAASGQWVDASQPRGGELRVGLSGVSSTFGGRFLPDGSTESLADVFAVRLDPRLVPALDTMNATLDEVLPGLGLPTPDEPSLGRTRFDVLIERTRIPLSVEAGITDWLSASATVPLVQGKSFVAPTVDTAGATAGPGSTAFGGNPTAFFDELGSEITQLESIVAADTLGSDAQARAEELLARARGLEDGLSALQGLSYLPTDSSAVGRSLGGLYGEVRGEFGEFGLDIPELGLASPIDAATAGELASPARFGLEPIESRDTGIKIGDIELGLSLQPINTFRVGPNGRRPAVPLRARIDVRWHLPASNPPAPERLTDPGTGDGQTDIAVGGVLDVGLGSRFWISTSGSYRLQTERTVRRLVTAPEAPIQSDAFTTRVDWDPGDVARVLVVPRFNFTRGIVVSLTYTYTHRSRDAVRLSMAPPDGSPFSAADLERGTEYTAQSLGFVVRYAATHWTGDDRDGLPIEVELSHHNTISGRSGLVPDRSVWRVGLRWYVPVLR